MFLVLLHSSSLFTTYTFPATYLRRLRIPWILSKVASVLGLSVETYFSISSINQAEI